VLVGEVCFGSSNSRLGLHLAGALIACTSHILYKTKSSFTKRVLSKGKATEPPKRGLAILRSRERAAQGFRMVLAWCRQWCTAQYLSVTSQRVIALLVCTIVCCALYQYTAPDGTSTIRTSTSACSCHAGVNVNDTTTVLPNPETAIMYLHRPQRPFHGNHWFHVGEYYLSRRKTVLDKLKIHAPQGGTFKHVKIVAQNHKLTGPMTKAAFSVLVLACLQELHEQYDGASTIESVELYASKQATLQFADATSEVHTVIQLDSRSAKHFQEGARARFQSRSGPIFGYYARSGDYEARFVDYRNDIESDGAMKRSGETGTGSVNTGSFNSGAVRESSSLRVAESAGGVLQRCLSMLGVSSAAQAVRNSGEVCECGIYVGAVGETPIPTAEWFDSDLEADSLRRAALEMCGDRDDSSSGAYTSTSAEERAVADTRAERTSTGERVLRLLIYQRDLNRRFTDLAALEGQLHTRNNLILHGQPTYSNHSTNSDGAVRWEVSVWRHSEQASPCALIKALNRADVFLTAHGFQSTGEFHRMRSACVQLTLKRTLLQSTLRVSLLAACCVALGLDVNCVHGLEPKYT
jgi:hypothetical protein